MRSKTSYLILIIIICSMSLIVAPCFSSSSIVNYDNHPDLKKAMEYDLTMDMMIFLKEDGTFDQALYDSYVKKADRELAEKYYLSYLKDVNEPFQRARVYAKLGALFSGAVSRHVTPPEEIDHEKAIMYYRKVLEEEPNRLGDPTINARAALIGEPNNPEERFTLYMDYYEFLLSIDAAKLQENYLPFMPGNKKLSDRAAKQMMNVIVARREVSEYNLVYEAVNVGRRRLIDHPANGAIAVDPKYLIQLTERFPQTRLAELANTELEKIKRTEGIY